MELESQLQCCHGLSQWRAETAVACFFCPDTEAMAAAVCAAAPGQPPRRTRERARTHAHIAASASPADSDSRTGAVCLGRRRPLPRGAETFGAPAAISRRGRRGSSNGAEVALLPGLEDRGSPATRWPAKFQVGLSELGLVDWNDQTRPRLRDVRRAGGSRPRGGSGSAGPCASESAGPRRPASESAPDPRPAHRAPAGRVRAGSLWAPCLLHTAGAQVRPSR